MDRKIILLNTGDPSNISGGNLYNQHISDACRRLGISVELLFISENDKTISIDESAFYLIDSLMIRSHLDFNLFTPKNAAILLHMCPSMDVGLSDQKRDLILIKEKELFQVFPIISAGRNNLNYIKQTLEIEVNKATIIPPGIDSGFEQKVNFLALPKQLLTVGSILPAKGLMRTLQVLNKCKDYEWTWHHYGAIKDTSFFNELNAFIIENQLKDRASFHGVIDHKDINEVMLEHDLMLHFSDYENNSMVIREAIGSDLPFISTPVGDSEHLMSLNVGSFTLSFDPVEIANTLIAYLSDANTYRSLVESTQHVAMPTWDRSARALIQFFEEI